MIDGADSTLDSMEKVPVNAKHRPLREIKLLNVSTVCTALPCAKMGADAPGGECLPIGYNTCQPDCGRSGIIKVVDY